jgi:adenosine kinase
MKTEYKISLLGPIPYDHILTLQNESLDRYGCLVYPAIALSQLLGKKSHIIPVSHVRKKDQQAIKIILQGHPGIELQHIKADADQGDVIRLQFLDKNKRLEKQSGFMDPIMPVDVKNLLDSNYFVCLPVTDFEIALETLQFIKSYSKATVIFSAQGPTTTMIALGDRLPKFWVDRDLWLPYIDVLTMTESQVKCSWFAKEYTLEELDAGEFLSDAELNAFAEHCFNKGVRALYVTSSDGSCKIFARIDGKVLMHHAAAAKINATVVDTTGRGGSFVAGITFGLIHTGDYVKAAYYGNVINAQRTRSMDYEVFDSLETTITMVKENYG